MNSLSLDEGLDDLAARLATLIDASAGDYPVVCFPEDDQFDCFWVYSKLGVSVVVDSDRPPAFIAQEAGDVRICVRSFTQNIDLLRMTEGIRQRSEYPFVQLSRCAG